MPKINFSAVAQVVDGPKVAINPPALEIDAYDKIDSPIAPTPNATDPDRRVELAPGATAGAVRLFMMYADRYAPNPLTYKTAAGATAITLDQPVVLWGRNSVKLLNDTLSSLDFRNPDATPNTVHILIARDATP
jgi:hypothetical protein